jgi:hypothetical protein
VGVDFAGTKGGQSVVAIVDEIRSSSQAEKHFVLHLGWEDKATVEGNRFELVQGDKRLIGWVVSPADVEFEASANPPYMHFVFATTAAPRIEVVLLLQAADKPVPEIKASAKGFADGVSVAGRTVKLVDGKFVFDK